MSQVVIIDYGAGNIFSVQKAFDRLGVTTVLSADKKVIECASHVIFPGVGHAHTAMKNLKTAELDLLIPKLTMPVLGICLGMQLMCTHSEEGNVNGLSIFNHKVVKFSTNLMVPHMGWNDVAFIENNKCDGPYYFVHSYFAEIGQNTWACTNYPAPFSAALRKENFWGVQFHPEKSGKMGEQLIHNFLKT